MTDTPTPDNIVEELDGRCGMRHCEDHPWLGRAADEIERLQAWKREAMDVLAMWDTVFEMAPERPQDLGRRRSDIVADYVIRLRMSTVTDQIITLKNQGGERTPGGDTP